MCNNSTVLQEKVGLRELQYIKMLSHSDSMFNIGNIFYRFMLVTKKDNNLKYLYPRLYYKVSI